MDAIALGVFSSRLAALCEEMGAALQQAAFSPNIKDRRDFSCAVFDARGRLCAQAAHIPVHLGSMAYAMADIVEREAWAPGDMLILNDPYLGGTHLPDVTLVAPVFVGGALVGFVANRAHHAHIGAEEPGSMPLARHLSEEGVVIPPTHLVREGAVDWGVLSALLADEWIDTDSVSGHLGGDFSAQLCANRIGVQRLEALVAAEGMATWQSNLVALNDYADRLARAAWADLPAGTYCFADVMDDDGQGYGPVPIRVALTLSGDTVAADFTGTAPQVAGNINCPLSVTAAAVLYVFRCLLPDHAPACEGLFRAIRLQAEPGLLVNSRPPAAVAAGNVETASRIVDTVLGALAQALPERIPAASQGTMNNLALGARGEQAWDYYETAGGGMGASARGPGLSAMQTHMTNTLNTPVESLERHCPLRVHRYAIRRGSGGAGRHRGGDGLVREIEFLAPARFSLLTERRTHAPWGLAGGAPGRPGANRLNGQWLPGKCSRAVRPGDRLVVETPGGGGWGKPEQNTRI